MNPRAADGIFKFSDRHQKSPLGLNEIGATNIIGMEIFRVTFLLTIISPRGTNYLWKNNFPRNWNSWKSAYFYTERKLKYSTPGPAES